MIIDDAIRVVRYVEIDENGQIRHQNFHAHVGRKTEEEWFAALVEDAAFNGHAIVRLCNHAAHCRNPILDKIEGDGKGGIRAKAEHPDALKNVELWDAAKHERAFLPVDVVDGNGEVAATKIVRFEPGEWTPEMKTERLTTAGLAVKNA